MKLKLDENLPESLIETLRASGHDVDNVRSEVWQAKLMPTCGRRLRLKEGFSLPKIWIFQIFESFLQVHITGFCW